MKKIFSCIWTITVILSLLSGCDESTSHDIKNKNFYKNNCDGQFNAITIDFGENSSGIYYIDENYGIISNHENKYLFCFDYFFEKHKEEAIIIYVTNQQTYYRAIVDDCDGTDSLYYGKLAFEGAGEFSDDDTVLTISPDDILTLESDKISVDPGHNVVMTKTLIPEEDVIPFETAVKDMNLVPDAYFDFLSDPDNSRFSCELANLWINGSTMIGEWSTNGIIIPIRMKLHKKVPYVEIYDISGSSEKLILKSTMRVIDESSLEIVEPEGNIFYVKPATPVIISKTNIS